MMPDLQSPLAEDDSASKPFSEQHGVMLAAAVLALVGWGGLLQLVLTTRPRIGGELWLFFLLLQFAVAGTALPLLRLFSLRHSLDAAPLPTSVIVRRSIWAGILLVGSAWLLIPRALSPFYVLILALILLLIEIFLRNREMAHER